MASDQRPPLRQVRARFDEQNIVVYQAYSPEIAEPAVSAGRFEPPFKSGRMTWIKPSFRWMVYRCGWALKPGQERVLEVTITRDGFEWALAHSCLSHYDPTLYASHEQWLERKEATPVRVQWDPERSLLLEPLDHRSIQIGLAGEASRRYVDEWVVGISDGTARVRDIHELVEAGDLAGAQQLLPREQPYPVPDELQQVLGMV